MKRSDTKSAFTKLAYLSTTAILLIAILPNAVFAAADTGPAWTAAKNIIRNTVTVKYKNAADTQQTDIVKTVDITVALVGSAPTLSAPVDQSTTPGTAKIYNYTITSTANGFDTYAITRAITNSAGITSSTAVLSPTSIDLGATTVAAAGTITADADADLGTEETFDITVPSDDAGGDSSVNGIVATDKVVIGGKLYTVKSVTDNGGAPGTSTIKVVCLLTSTAIALGDTIGEQATFDLTVTPTTVNASTDQTIDVEVDADGAGTSAKDTTRTTVNVAVLSVTKYVRNVDTGTAGGGTTLSLAGATYYTTGIIGKPGEVLEYAVEIINSGSSDAKDVRIEDPIVAFTTYVDGSMKIWNGTTADVSGVSLTAVLDGLADTDAGEFDTGAKKVYFYPGTGGVDTTAGVGGTGGTFASTNPDTKAYCVFRVKID